MTGAPDAEADSAPHLTGMGVEGAESQEAPLVLCSRCLAAGTATQAAVTQYRGTALCAECNSLAWQQASKAEDEARRRREEESRGWRRPN